MDDTQHDNIFPYLTTNQVHELVAALRDVFGSNLSRAQFADRLLMFLEDVIFK
ncbi:hypothetical protein HDG32_004718 [Paraburkholderia sp. CI2]|uniref:hypothetical protein n=1 Tax=Paraburkholderia sp. CI2 TaxID=2723093 RepID=UPI00161EDA25|nr:hypothetical protein [Paraburkholderia sp. CI2]MBB5468588.1 hypothetical protein [Paraburkholderia sp. CI2]